VQTILIIDDELQIRKLLDITLTAEGYKTLFADTGKGGLLSAASHHPSMIILDLGLTDMDGQEVLKELREWYLNPILILSVRDAEHDIITALDAGANDFLAKPFRNGELMARIRASLRTTISKETLPVLEFGDLSIDLAGHVAKKHGEALKLTSTEFDLLALLAKNQGRVLTHQYILKEVWGFGYMEQTQYLRVFVAQLRKKIEDNPSKPLLILTESGIGYRFGQ
jgi:two-component system, OmpR family, KDP operon response regulator KdpE